MGYRGWKRLAALALALLVLAGTCAAGAEKTVLMTFTGDCTLGSEESTRNREDSFDSFVKTKGYDYFFEHFREMFTADDLTVINFEGVLSDSNAQESKIKRYRFRGPTEFVKILTGSSVEAASLSNNHTGDYGKQGEASTKKTLEENGISWFKNFTYTVQEKNGIKIALISLENSVIYNEFEKVKKLLARLKNEGEADAIVICWHTGLEYRGEHETNTERTSQAMVKYGADLVIMHHPHVLQGVNIANNRYIFYSLGNFVFGGNSAIRTEKHKLDQTVSSLYTMVLQVKMTFTEEGKYLGQQAIIYPAYTSSEAPVNNYQPYRVSAAEAEPVREAIQRDTAFDLPETTETDGLSRIELPYLPAFEDVMTPEGGAEGPQGLPEAASPVPTRDSRDQD